MATTTPNFGWAVPTSTDLVKDGAVAIETLGDSIDASLVDLKGGTTGQVLSKASNTDMDFAWVSDAAGMTNPMTTTGDTIYSSSGSTPARLGIGSTGQVLTVSGGIPSWASPASGGGMTAISTGTLSSTGVTFSSISGSYVNLELHITGFNVGVNRLYVRINGDSGSNYTGGYIRQRDGAVLAAQYANSPGQGTEIRSDGDVTPDSGATNTVVFSFPAYAASTGAKVISAASYALSTYKVPNHTFYSYTGTAGAITSLTIVSSGGTFSAGTYTLYGVK